MISTDGVKTAAQNLQLLDAQAIADDLNTQQSKTFVDPNCNPQGEASIDISNVSFCESPLDDRDKRLADFMAGLPQPKLPDDKTACTQAALKQLDTLIKTKFNADGLTDKIQQANFEEEKIETQLEIVSTIGVLMWMTQQYVGLPNLNAAIKASMTKAITDITATKIDDVVAAAIQAYTLTRLDKLIKLNTNIVGDKSTFTHPELAQARWTAFHHAVIINYTSDPVLSKFNNYLYQINKDITYTGRKPANGFGAVYQNASNALLKSPSPSIDVYYQQIIDGKVKMHDASYASSLGTSEIRAYAYASKGTADIQGAGLAQTLNIFFTQACIDLASLFSDYATKTPKLPTKQDVLDEISKINFCGSALPSALPATSNPTANVADLNHKTFDTNNKPTITDLDYWQHYSVYLDLINLLPTYWTIGLYIPTPAGIVKVPLPTIWTPLAVLSVPPVGLIVIFLTINGIAISPTVWSMHFPLSPPSVPAAPKITKPALPKGTLPTVPTAPIPVLPNATDLTIGPDGFNKLGFDAFGYNKAGFDANGFNKQGFDVNGFNAQGYNILGFDKKGFNKEGFDKNGYDVHGFNIAGINAQGQSITTVLTQMPTPGNPSLGIPSTIPKTPGAPTIAAPPPLPGKPSLPSTKALIPKISGLSIGSKTTSADASKNPSELTIMLRSSKAKINDNTGNKIANIPVVNGINTNPALTQSLPFIQDDLPTIKRMGLQNLPYVFYLNQWMKQYITGGGLP